MRLSLLAAGAVAVALLPAAAAAAAPAAPSTVRAPVSAGQCQGHLDGGTYCGYDRSNAYTERGDAGARVKELQSLLNYHGYSVGVDGYFGASTEDAVKRFQSHEHLTVDGKVGEQTWGYLRV
ncbi:peptidoglycan-binding protein [Kitasatospora sp. NPDC092948]|uniref:peptidoglycan-binding domain-containing protein n=1 Tax=Kitasatospora sp. NPDC092948 TaxID=3364088 RepID=UPI00381C651C